MQPNLNGPRQVKRLHSGAFPILASFLEATRKGPSSSCLPFCSNSALCFFPISLAPGLCRSRVPVPAALFYQQNALYTLRPAVHHRKEWDRFGVLSNWYYAPKLQGTIGETDGPQTCSPRCRDTALPCAPNDEVDEGQITMQK